MEMKIKTWVIATLVIVLFLLGIYKIRTFPESALLEATKIGDAAKVDYLIENGFDPDQRDPNTWTPLMITADRGFRETVMVLLNHGADVNAQNESGWTPLMFSTINGHSSIMSTLLEHQGNVNAERADGRTALMDASEKGHPNMVRTILEAGAEVNAQDENAWTALMYAAVGNHEKTFQVLLNKSANVNTKNIQGRTVLNEVVATAPSYPFEALQNSPSDAGPNGEDKKKALILESINDHVKSIKFLFAQRENIDNKNGKDPGDVMWVAMEEHVNSLGVLLDKRSDFYQIETHTPPQIVDEHSSLKIVKLLLANRAKVNEPDNQGMTPLMHAAKGGAYCHCQGLTG